jgi:hemerythrin
MKPQEAGAYQRDFTERHDPSAFLTWRPEWELGIDSMDADHYSMTDQLNQVADHLAGIRACKSPAQRARLFNALMSEMQSMQTQTRAHFADEEQLMDATNYPLTGEHRREHTMLLAELTEFMREISNRPIDQLDLTSLASLKHWFLGHLLDLDRNLAKHLYRVGKVHLAERH